MTHDGLLRRVVGPREPGDLRALRMRRLRRKPAGTRAPLPASLPSRAAATRWRIRRPNR